MPTTGTSCGRVVPWSSSSSLPTLVSSREVLPLDPQRRPRQSSLDRIDRIRDAVTEATGLDVAACLEVASLPVDRRHNSKIDRAHLADWATGVLEGGSVRNP